MGTLTPPPTLMLAPCRRPSRVICSGTLLRSSPWVLPSWNPMKAGCRLNSWPSPKRQKMWMEAHIKEDMMMKAKELGIEMDKESDWSDKEEGDWEDKEGD